MRVLITGSRDWEDKALVWGELDLLLVDARMTHQRLTVVHGDCPTGADRYARQWVERCRAVAEERGFLSFAEQEPYPADWRQGRHAGPYRNRQMVNAGADVCLAFLRRCTKSTCMIRSVHGSHGAGHCMSLARGSGVEVREFREGW